MSRLFTGFVQAFYRLKQAVFRLPTGSCRLLAGCVQAVYRLKYAVYRLHAYRLYAGCLQAVRRLLQAGASCLQAEAGCVYAVYRLLQVVYRLCRFSAVRFVNVENSSSVRTHLCLQSTSLAFRSLSLSRTTHGDTVTAASECQVYMSCND